MERRGTPRRKEGKENTREKKRKEERKKRKYTGSETESHRRERDTRHLKT